MQHFKNCIILFIIYLSFSKSYSQNLKIDTRFFHLDKTVNQNKSTFRFWLGSSDSTRQKLIIERICKARDTILYNNYVRDGIYKVEDRNNDGYKDFITNYHDYDVIYFFDNKKNSFIKTKVYMPMNFGLVDSLRNIYWGYRDAQYSEKYDYSILYKYIGFIPYIYYKIVYKTSEEYDERRDVKHIELYKFKKGDYANPVFIRRIKSENLSKFNYKKYWKENYRQLLGYH